MDRSDSDSQRALSRDETERYARHLLLPEIGRAGQEKLKASSVLVVGAGGLGCPALLYLAAAGVGRIGIVDFDTVEASNLQRQVLYGVSDVGKSKALAAAHRLADLNPFIELVPIEARLDSGNAGALLSGWDVVVNGVDTLPARYALSDAAAAAKIVHVHGAIHRFQGEVALFGAGGRPCYRCLHPNPPPPGSVPSCATAGVLGVLPGIVGSLQAAETIKHLLSLGRLSVGTLLLLDILAGRFTTLRLSADPNCPVCGENPRPVDNIAGCADTPAPIPEKHLHEINPTTLKQRFDRGDNFVLLDVREPGEFDFCHIDGATLIPLGSLPSRLAELDPDADTVVMCRSGKRSADAIAYLSQMGFTALANLRGGILAWSDDVDPSVPKY